MPAAGLRRFLASLALASLAALPLSGQSYLVHTYSEDDGLPSSMVHGLAQAPDGLMWFATRSGIASYDGRIWRAFGVADGLPGDSYLSIAVDELGVVWALAMSPRPVLSRYEDGRWDLLPSPPLSAGTGAVTSLAVSRAGGGLRVAVGTARGGLAVFEDEDWIMVGTAEGLPSLEISAVAAVEGDILVATRAGLARLDGLKAVPLTRGSDGLGTPLLGLAPDYSASGVRIWLLGRGRLSVWQGGKLTTSVAEAPSPVNEVFPLLFGSPDGHDGLVYGNPEGLYHYDRPSGTIRHLGFASGLISEGGTDLLLDREGNLWISGLRGVSKVVSFRFANYRATHGLLQDEVTAVVEAAPGRLAIGHARGLSFFDGQSFTTRPFASRETIGATETRVQELCVDRAGTIWIAASNLGVGRIAGSGPLTWYRDRQGVGAARSVALDASGRICILDEDGLKVLRGGRFELYPAPEPISGRRIILDADGSLWLPHFREGLARLAGSEVRSVRSPSNPDANNVYSIRRDSRNVVWAGTRAGLCVVSGDAIELFRADGFALSRPVYSILEDGRGRMWFGTDNGVVLWDGARARAFTRRQGFVGQETNRAAAIVDHAGRIWIGSDLGLSRYDDRFDVEPESLPAPLVTLQSVEAADGVRTLGAAPLSFPTGINTLTFRFRGVSFVDEQSLRFRCRLDGFDTDWSQPISAARPEARYTNLPQGRYVFFVQASSTPGVWSPAAVSAALHIRGPFWRTWWFLGLCVVAAGLVFQAGLSAAAQRRRARELEAKVLERTGELRASLAEKEVLLREIHHRVKNNLQIVASLLYLQARGVPEPARRLFQESRDRLRTMALIHETLYRSTELSRIEVPEYFTTLAGAIFQTLGAEQVAVRLDLKLAPVSLAAETAVTCGIILNELLTNALKYAFPGGRTGTVGIEFEEASPGAYRFAVWDDGRGLPPGLDVRAAETLGLKLVDGLVRQLEGTLEVSPPPGARFTIRFRRA